MKSGFVDKIITFLKPKLKRAGITIAKVSRKCFKSGQKVVKVLRYKTQQGIEGAKAWLEQQKEIREQKKTAEADLTSDTEEWPLKASDGADRAALKPSFEKKNTTRSEKAMTNASRGENSFREAEKTSSNFTPSSVEEFIHLIQRTPKNVLSKSDRARIAAVMSFNGRMVKDLMASRTKMIFVKEVDLLGPIMLDKLYKSGLTSFPVVDNYRRLKGVLHTEALNALEIKETDRASKYMEKAIYYLYDNDSLMQAIEKMQRTNCYYFFVVDTEEHLVGFLTVEMILDYFLGK